MAKSVAAAEGATRPESLRQMDRRRGLTLERGATGAHRRGRSSQVTGQRGGSRRKVLLPPLFAFSEPAYEQLAEQLHPGI